MSVDKLESRGNIREKDVDDMTNKVQAFYDDHTGVMNDIREVIKEERSLGAVAGDTATIKQQQDCIKRR